MRFTGMTVLKVIDGRIVEEVGLDDGVTALTQLGLIKVPPDHSRDGPRRECFERSRAPSRSAFLCGASGEG